MEKRLLVIQEHHTKRNNLHWDVRFEADGSIDTYQDKRTTATREPWDTSEGRVLRSYVIPKHQFPDTRGKVLMAIHVEDHPWNYRTFQGTIKDGYGAGEVKLLFCDDVEVSTFTDDKITFCFEDNWYTIFKTTKGHLIKLN